MKVEPAKRRYRVLAPVTIHFEHGAYEQDDEFEHAFADGDEEWEALDKGLIALLPDWYQVVGGSAIEVNLIEVPASLTTRVALPGERFEAALPLNREDQLRYHIRRVAPEPKPAAKKSTKE